MNPLNYKKIFFKAHRTSRRRAGSNNLDKLTQVYVDDSLKLFNCMELIFSGIINSFCDTNASAVYQSFYKVQLLDSDGLKNECIEFLFMRDKHDIGLEIRHINSEDPRGFHALHSITTSYGTYPFLGDISCFRHFVWARQPADADCMISIAYYSKLLNHMS